MASRGDAIEHSMAGARITFIETAEEKGLAPGRYAYLPVLLGGGKVKVQSK